MRRSGRLHCGRFAAGALCGVWVVVGLRGLHVAFPALGEGADWLLYVLTWVVVLAVDGWLNRRQESLAARREEGTQ